MGQMTAFWLGGGGGTRQDEAAVFGPTETLQAAYSGRQ